MPQPIYNAQWAKENIAMPDLLAAFGHEPVEIITAEGYSIARTFISWQSCMILNNRTFSPAECSNTIEIVEIANDNPMHNTTQHLIQKEVTVALPCICVIQNSLR